MNVLFCLIIFITIIIIYINVLNNIETFVVQNTENEGDTKYNLFTNNIKKDFNLDVTNKKYLKYILNNNSKTSIGNVIGNIKLNKRLSNFKERDIYYCICNAYINTKSKEFSSETASYYTKYMNEYKSLHEQYIYEKMTAFVRNVKKKKNITIKELKSSHAKVYNQFVNLFINTHIYSVFSNTGMSSSHPFFSIDLTYKSYIEYINIDEAISSEYNEVLKIVNKTINKKNIVFNDTLEFKKNIFDILNIKPIIIEGIDNIINQILQTDDKCWIQNNGDMDVNMRTCNVYFTPYKNMCDNFEEIFKLSNLQLDFLINQSALLHQTSIIGKKSANIHVFDDKFIKIINNYPINAIIDDKRSPNIKNNKILIEFINVLKTIYGVNVINSNYETTIKFVNKLISNIFNIFVVYNKRNYYCLDLYRIRIQKQKYKNMQICKLKFPELQEISSDTKYKNIVENKIMNYNHINPTELWGSCFYSLNNQDLTDNAKKNIINDMQTKYNLTPVCNNNVIENIKCKSGCTLNNKNKFLAFNTSSFGYNNKIKLNSDIKIPKENIFMKIKINMPNIHSGIFNVSFVSFNNETKQFENTKNDTYLNDIIRDNLFTIKSAPSGFSIGPNTSERTIYICSFYNNVLYEFTTKKIKFSLFDLAINDKFLGHHDVYKKISNNIWLLSKISNCYNVNSYNNNYGKTKGCLNSVKDLLNQNMLESLNIILSNKQLNKSRYEEIINNINTNIRNKQTEFYQKCENPIMKQLFNLYQNLIQSYNTHISNQNRNLEQLKNDKDYWENRYNPKWPWEFIRKFIMIHEKRTGVYITQLNIYMTEIKRRQIQSDYDTISARCRYITNEINNLNANKQNNINHINKYIEPEIQDAKNNIGKYHMQNSNFFMQNIETYHINYINFVKEIYQYNNNIIPSIFIEKFLKRLNDQIFLSSTDDCIYIQLN